MKTATEVADILQTVVTRARHNDGVGAKIARSVRGSGVLGELTTALTGANNDLTYALEADDVSGSVAYVDPDGSNQALSVSVAGDDITVHLATGAGTAATGTLTSDNTNVADGATVVIGAKTYTFKTDLTPTEGEVLIGANADESLTNLKNAINLTGTPGTDYDCAAANPDVSAGAVTSHAIVLTSKLTSDYDEANSIATTETSTHLSFGAATLAGGADGAITSTADEVAAAVRASAAAAALVTVANAPGNDGSGVVTAMSPQTFSAGGDEYLSLTFRDGTQATLKVEV